MAGVVESVKAAADLYMPVSGEVVEVNEALRDDPSLANSDGLGNGWFFKVRVADMATAIVMSSASSQIRLLDLGCGDGQLLGLVMARLAPDRRARCQPHGVEISNELARQAQVALSAQGGHCVHAPALQGLASCEAGYFDLIVLSSFLEHEIQPLALLREVSRTLRPGGQVLIKVPNYACWNRWLRGRRWCGYRWPDHVNYFTPATLAAAGKVSGLSVARLNLSDRFPLSDSLYAVLRKA